MDSSARAGEQALASLAMIACTSNGPSDDSASDEGGEASSDVTTTGTTATNAGDATSATTATSAGDATSSAGTTGAADPLTDACTTWCEHELMCHPDAFPSVTQCVDACLGDAADGPLSAMCIQAFIDSYLCRAELACNAASGCEAEDAAIDTACGGDGG